MIAFLLLGFVWQQPDRKKLSDKIFEVFYQYELLRKIHIAEGDEPFIEGVRYRYQFLESIANIADLRQVLGVKVFLSGPHGIDVDLKSEESFGHYNPIFIEKIHHTFDSLTVDRKFRIGGQLLYNVRFKQMARIYYKAYTYLHEEASQEAMATLDALTTENFQIDRAENGGQELSNLLNRIPNKIKEEGYDFYNADTAGRFWVRRAIDGTDDEFFKLLNFVLDNFDKDFKNGNR